MYLSRNCSSGKTSGFFPSNGVCSFLILDGDKEFFNDSSVLSMVCMVNSPSLLYLNGVSGYPL